MTAPTTVSAHCLARARSPSIRASTLSGSAPQRIQSSWRDATSTWKISASRRIFSGSSRRMARSSSWMATVPCCRPQMLTQIRTVSAACSASWGARGAPSRIRVSSSGWARSERMGMWTISASGRKGQGLSPAGSGRQPSIPSRMVSSMPLGQVARFRMFPWWVLSTAEQPSSAESIRRAVSTVCRCRGAEETRARMSDTRDPEEERSWQMRSITSVMRSL